MREKIIRAILDSGDSFISGEQLSKALGISRTAIWKHINALREEGYNIESVNKLTQITNDEEKLNVEESINKIKITNLESFLLDNVLKQVKERISLC